MSKQEEIREGIEILFNDCTSEHAKYIAGEILNYLHSQGVVIKVDRELPKPKTAQSNWYGCYGYALDDMLKAGYVATEPLVKEKQTTQQKEKPRCPHAKGSPVAYDFKRDKVYEGADMCTLTDKWCLLEQGQTCDEYELFLRDYEDVSRHGG